LSFSSAADVVLRLITVAVVLFVAGAGVELVTGGGGDSEPAPGVLAIERYLAAWSRGDDRAAAALTDAPAQALRALRLNRRGLDGAAVRAALLDQRTDGRSTRARVRVRWTIPRFGIFEYEVRIAASATGQAWRVRWGEKLVHPELDADTRLGTTADWPRRAPILDRWGRPLITERPDVDIAAEVDKARDPGQTASALAELLDIGAAALERRIAASPEGRFIPVVTLRRADFEPLEERLTQIPGVSLNRTTTPPAPTRSFGRAVLGTVGPATAEQLERSSARADAQRLSSSSSHLRVMFSRSPTDRGTRRSPAARRRREGGDDDRPGPCARESARDGGGGSHGGSRALACPQAPSQRRDEGGCAARPELLATLRGLLREVVIGGTGTALAAVPGEVLGKSGTAEYGGGDPPPTHAWFIATRGDLALSVLVEGGSSGGRSAAPIARRFFDALL
jgi:hypothetical protein